MPRALRVMAGAEARARLGEHGWDPDLFSLLLGASGGPKWLVLSRMDRVLFGEFLLGRVTPLHSYGTSIGAWRHVCLAQDDPVAAIGRLEERYIHQRFPPNPGPSDITAVGREMLEHVLGAEGAHTVADHPVVTTHVGAARGRSLAGAGGGALQQAGLALAAMSNAISRRLLGPWYQRVVFSSRGTAADADLDLADFSTASVPLTADNLPAALLASGSIPRVLDPVVDPPGAPPGRYWDGGIVDYHHDLGGYRGDGLILYPHFFDHLIPGWFDKPFGRRRARGRQLDRVVLLTPSEAFVASLPGGRIPDRNDFMRYGTEERFEVWWKVVARAEELADDLASLFGRSDPLDGVEAFGSS